MADQCGSGQAAEALALQARALLAGLAAAAPFLDGWPVAGASRRVAPRALPVLDWLADARRRAIPSTQALVDAVTAAAPALAWHQTYTAEDFGTAFLERYGWTEVFGLRGPIASAALACGILMLGPDTHYPAHAHEAEELYLPLAGTALWTRGEDDDAWRPPGTPIHHPSWMPHAMRTRDEPLLALYLWRGRDLAARSRILGRT